MPFFDVVSEVNRQEVRNALDQAQRELRIRFDFKGVDAGFQFEDDALLVWAEEEFQVNQLAEILKTKLAGRKVDVDALHPQPMEASGRQKRQRFSLVEGIDRDHSKKITKLVKDSRLKLQSQIQGPKVRITGKKRDDLQDMIQRLKDAEIGVPLQFNNFRD